MLRNQVIAEWKNLKSKLATNKLVVYQSWKPHKVPVTETIEAKKYQELLNHLGVNTLGINELPRKFATYEEVISAITEFKERVITNADNHYQSQLKNEVSEKRKLTSKLEQVKELVNNDEIEQLKELVRKGEI